MRVVGVDGGPGEQRECGRGWAYSSRTPWLSSSRRRYERPARGLPHRVRNALSQERKENVGACVRIVKRMVSAVCREAGIAAAIP